MEKVKEWVQNYVANNPDATGAQAWDQFTASKIGKKYSNDPVAKNYVQGFLSRMDVENAGIENDKGEMSKKNNPAVFKLDNKESELKLLPDTTETQAKVKTFEVEKDKLLKAINGKSNEEQQKIVSEALDESPKKDIVFSPKSFSFSDTAKKIEQAEDKEEIDRKESAFLKSWASTHPSWGKILSSKELSWGQKVQLVGAALANLGANVTLGAKAGFEHSSFAGVPWDFKQAVDKYMDNELDTVLKGEQNARAKATTAQFWKDYEKDNGKEAVDELIATFDLYGDNPTVLKDRLASMGIHKNADEIKELSASLEKTNLSESAKQKVLETGAKAAEVKAQELLLKLKNNELEISDKTKEKLIQATNALNSFNRKKFTSDEATYDMEKTGRYIRDAINVVEGIAGAVTGKVVGTVKDGLIQSRGIPQKVVRADGTEIQLDPNDNIYATKNKLTTEKDDGSPIVHMSQADEIVTVQTRLGSSGGQIRKDFDYYLSKLRG